MRRRRRYIAFEFTGGKASKSGIMRAVTRSLRASNPEFDPGMLKLVIHDISSRRSLMRCGHKQVGEFKEALAGIKKIGDVDVSLVVLGVSGTIKAAKRKFLAPHQAKR